jgi:glycosyltransferase involved in cell wall biosynthesis
VRAPRASVVIPTKNAANSIDGVLSAVFRQDYPDGFEVMVVDSGSDDETLDIVARYPARTLGIPPSEFNHGGTRNVGAENTAGEYIVFLTHDAEPVGDRWLANLVAPFKGDQNIAGCFGRHVADPTSDLIDARNLERHFASFGDQVRVFTLEPGKDYGDSQWMYDFFSDNNSALRRTAWKKHPFPITNMAEDQLWARIVMKAGYAKAYVPDAVVVHSHSYPASEWLRRWYDEFAAYRDMDSPVQIRGLRAAGAYFIRNSRDDVAYLRAAGRGAGAQARSVANNLARATGAFLGSNYPAVPPALRRRLSMQRRAIEGR